MHVMKRLAAALLAGACFAGMVMPAVPGAAEEATYDPYDVDRNGDVNMSDLVLLNKYLFGAISDPDYAKYDVNQNLVVDYLDSECLINVVVEAKVSVGYYSKTIDNIMPSPVVSGTTQYPEDTGNREYIACNYNSKQRKTYTLALSTTTVNDAGISTFSMYDGIDTRHLTTEKDVENTGIVLIKGYYTTITSVNDSYTTGFIVGDHVIATAAHCIYNRDRDEFFTGVRIYNYTKDGEWIESDYHSLTPVEIHIPKNYNYKVADKGTDYNNYDYALITVEEDLSDYFHFSLGETYNLTDSNFKNVPIYITGVPNYVKKPDFSSKSGVKNEERRIYTDEGRIWGTNANEIMLNTSVYASGGNSGSPIYTITKSNINGNEAYTYTVLGILKGSNNNDTSTWGARVTKHVYEFYMHNPNASYS